MRPVFDLRLGGRGTSVAFATLLLLAGDCSPPRPLDPGHPIDVTIDVAQAGGDSSRSDAGADGPPPPLRRAWTWSSGAYGDFGQPAIADGLIYVTSDKLYVIDRTGRERWRFDPQVEGGVLSDPVSEDQRSASWRSTGTVAAAYGRGRRPLAAHGVCG